MLPANDLPTITPTTPGVATELSYAPAHLTRRRRSRTPLWIGLSLLILLIVAYAGLSVFFMSHFGFNTTIDGINSSFKTVAEVEGALNAQAADYTIVLKGRAGSPENLTAAQVGLAHLPDGQVQKILSSQNPLLWITTPFSAFKAVTEPSVTLDEASLRKAVDALRLMDEANMTTPSDAQIVFKDSAYVIDAEDPGTTIDTTKIYVAVSQAIRTLEPQLDLDAAGCYVGPDVLATNDELAQTLERYNTYVPFQITYTFGEETEVLGAEVALQWYGIADDGTYWFNEGALGAWVASFAQRHDTVGTTRSFKTATGEDATVEGGTYGWEVDQEAEYAAIIDALNNHRGETRDPCYLETATDHGLDLDWGKSYIEVNLTTQYLYFVREGQIALESDVVTGAPWGGRATPEGVYDILWMESPSILRGDYIAPGQREYETQVSFWMQITYSGVGMHDATWQSRFGGDWYLNNGSHGCINMPWDKAQELYEIAWDGLPVIIHY